MKQVHKLLLWFFMLSKRLYKKPTFVILMVLIPLLALGYTAITSGDSGMVTIGLACQGDDPLVQDLFSQLQSDSQLLSFQICSDPEEAESLLRGGKLDAVWVFPENIAEKIEEFVKRPTSSNAFITVLEREDSVLLMITREKLSEVTYPHIAQRVFVHFMRDLAPELSHLSDEQLLEYYHRTDLSFELFDFEGADNQQKDTGYLLSPLRGLLATLILLCSLASAMYYIRDMETGTFAWVSKQRQLLPELGCQLTATLHIGIICLICLAFTGLAGNIWGELAVWIMYSLCCSLFAIVLRQLCGSIKLLGTILPLVIVVVLVICPVFFDLGSLRPFQYCLPPTYYINGTHGNYLYLAGYTAILAAITLVIQFVKNRSPKF